MCLGQDLNWAHREQNPEEIPVSAHLFNEDQVSMFQDLAGITMKYRLMTSIFIKIRQINIITHTDALQDFSAEFYLQRILDHPSYPTSHISTIFSREHFQVKRKFGHLPRNILSRVGSYE
jgi:hypothetical protein